VRRGQEPVVGPAPHHVAEVDQEGSGNDGRGEPLAGGQADGKAGDVGSGEGGHKAVVGVRGGAEGVFAGVLLRRVVEEAQVDVGFVGEERGKTVLRHVEGDGESGQHAVAHGGEGVEIGHHVLAQIGHPVRPLVSATQRNAGDDVGMVSASVVADKEAFVLVRLGRVVHSGGGLHRGVHWHIADVVFVQFEVAFFFERQGVETAGRGESPIDDRLRHSMTGGVEEANVFAGVAKLRCQYVQRAGLAGEIRTEVDDRNQC